LKSLWRESWGPRLDDILRACLSTLANHGRMTICEVGPLLLDSSFRRRLVGRLDDPVLSGFWAWYEALSDAERRTAIAPVLNKIRAITMRPGLGGILGQTARKLNAADVMRDGKILLVNLASGVLGEQAAALVGALVVAEIWHATTARAAIPR